MYQKEITVSSGCVFWISKRFLDLTLSIIFLPILATIALVIFCLNLFYNKGSVFYIQKRMGKNCVPFYAIKFRTMINIKKIDRKYSDPLEHSRITSLGYILRRTKIDELPQIINVIKGEMSLIGPRPDYYKYALEYLKSVEGYRERHTIRPGISGLSQIRLGYVESLEATSEKASIDNYYIQNVGYIIEFKIILNTILTILRAMGK